MGWPGTTGPPLVTALYHVLDSAAITLLLLVRATHIYIYIVVLHAHPVRGESHIQRNATGEVAITSPPFYNEPHQSHVLCVKAELGTTFTSWSQHHCVAIRKARAACAQSFTLWQQATIEIMRRNHSITACSCHVYILLFFAHILFMVNHTFNATPPERLQQHLEVFAYHDHGSRPHESVPLSLFQITVN